MKNHTKTYLFEEMPIPRAFVTLAVPTVISSLVMILYNLADTYFVGMLGDAVQNSAITLSAPALLAFNAVNNLFGVGSSSMMSRALGRHEYDTVHKSSAFGFWCSLICGVMFSLIFTSAKPFMLNLLGADSVTADALSNYLFWTVTCGAAPSILNVVMAYLVRSEGASLHASLGTMSGCILNIILDPIFILPWGLGLGASGAGLATFVSNCVACLYYFVLLAVKRGKTHVCINLRMFKPERKIVLGVFAVGIPSSIQNLLNVTGMTILNNFTAASGFGENAIAAMGVAQKIYQIPFSLAIGISQGVMPLVGYNYASKNIRRMKRSFIFTTSVSLGIMAVISVSYFIFSDSLVRLFMNIDAVVEFGGAFLRGYAIGQVFIVMDFIAVGVFQACGMGKFALVFAILRKIVFEIPLIFILNAVFSVWGLPYAQSITEIILSVIAVVVVARLFKRLESKNRISV